MRKQSAGAVPHRRRTLDLATLEDRVLLSAAPANPDLPILDLADTEPLSGIESIDFAISESTATRPNEEQEQPEPSANDRTNPAQAGWELSGYAASTSDDQLSNELVFVSANVHDLEMLLDGLVDTEESIRKFHVVILDATRDGVEQVTDTLAMYRNLDAVHFLTHGTDGAIQLGDTWLTHDRVSDYSTEMAQWRGALRPQADLLFYACNVASSREGQLLVDAFQSITGAGVAASVDATGHTLLGGDWQLEYVVGHIEAAVALSGDLQSSWHNLLPSGPVSAPVTLNQTLSDVQKGSDVAIFANGSFVAVWDSLSDGSGEGIYARLFTATGAPAGNEFRVNQTTLNPQVDPSIGRAPNGDFVVVWQSTQGGNSDIYARIFNSSGTALTNEILVNAGHTAGDQQNADVAMDDLGNFVVVWELEGPGDASGVFGQRLFANGSLDGGIFRIHSTVSGNQDNAAVAVGPTGSFVITWTDRSGSNPVIRGQRYSSTGAGQGEFLVQAASVGEADLSSVAIDRGGNFVVAWGEKNADASQSGVRMRRFNAPGSPMTGDVLVNSTTTSDQFDPSVAMDADGDFVISWTSVNQDGDAKGVVARAYRATGTPDSAGELLVNTSTAGDQSASQIALNDSGKFVVSWQGQSAADPAGVYARLYAWPEAAGSTGPIIALPGSAVDYTAGSPMAIIDAAATVSDPNSPNFDGGQLTVSIVANSSADDRLEISVGGIIRLSGNVVEWKSTGPAIPIGTFSGGTDGFTPLVVTLNANADATKTRDLLRNIGYRHGSSSTPTHFVTVQFLLSDGDGGISVPVSETINVLGVNQAPAVSVPGTQSTNINTPLAFSLSDGNLVSVDDPDAAATDIQVTVQAANGTVTLDLGGQIANPTGNEVLTNSTITNAQSEAAIARDANGSYVIAWSGYRNSPNPNEILFQIYDANGNPSGGQTIANTTTDNVQSAPDIAMDQNGNFVIVWSSLGQDHPDGQSGIYGRLFTAGGSPIGGEFLVNTVTAERQLDPRVGMDASGHFVVTWVDQGLDGSNEGIFAQRFDSAGVKQGTQFQVNVETTGKQMNPDVAMDPQGNFVIVWDSAGQDSGDGQSGVYARRFDAAGNALGGERLVNTTVVKEQSDASIAISGSGEFVVVWTSKDNDGSGRGIFGQLFNGAGQAIGPTEFLINTTTALEQLNADVTMDGNGHFTVVWQSINQDNPGDMLSGVYLQQFDKAGSQIGGERRVNTTVSGVQSDPVVAMDADGDIVVAWQGNGAGDASGVFHRRFDNASELTFSAGDGVNDATMTFTGSITEINGVLDGMRFTPDADFIGLATVTIQADDLGNRGSGGSKQDSNSVDIQVLEIPGAVGPIADADTGANEVSENAPNGSYTGLTAVATDPNASDSVLYSLDDDAGGRFTIHATNGTVLVADGTQLDYETATSHSITVRATSSDGSVSTAAFTIALTPLNDHAPAFSSSDAPSINETQTIVVTLAASDADLPNQTITYSISGGIDQNKFQINGVNQLVFVTAPDFENPTDAGLDNVYEVEVTANDGAGAGTIQLVQVTVTDLVEGNNLIVDTTDDTVDGSVGSIGMLLADRGSDGRISLREAILATNNTPNGATPDSIQFSIPDIDPGHFYYRDDGIAGSLSLELATVLDDASIADFDPDYPFSLHSWFRINLNPLAGELTITDAVIIDGYSQPGAGQNTLVQGSNAKVRIELTSFGGDGHNGIRIDSGGAGSTVRGLAINGFDRAGLLVDSGADAVTIHGNFIGTDITGTIDRGNGNAGIEVRSSDNRIGGANLEDRNIISGNGYGGVVTYTAGPIESGNIVQNNYIGLDATGQGAVGNDTVGVQVWNQNGMQIRGNIVSGNAGDGIWLRAGSMQMGTVIEGNWIGTSSGGVAAMANAGDGIQIDLGALNTTIGGTATGQANVIGHNGGAGIEVAGGSGGTIRANSIFGNAGLGINIVGSIGGDTNDANDADSGPNELQNYPVLGSAVVAGTSITIAGTLHSTPNLGAITLDFYWSATADSSSHGEASRYIGSAVVATDGSGNAAFSSLFSGAFVPVGSVVTATATDPAGNTSEFARNVVASFANTAPQITSSSTPAVAENQAVVYTLTATDSDLPAQLITFSITGGVDAAFFEINTSNQLKFLTAPDFEQPADFFLDNVYQVHVSANDGNGGITDRLISVTVTPVNDIAPVFTSANAIAVNENTTDIMTAAANDLDDPGQPLMFFISGTDSALFTLDSGTGELRFASAPNYESPTDFDQDNDYLITLEIYDGTFSTFQNVTVTVLNVNDAPVAVPDSYSVSEDQTLIETPLAGILANDSDEDGHSLFVVLVDGPDHASSFIVRPDGSLEYTPRLNYFGSDSFSYKVSDGTLESNVVTVDLTVDAENDPPHAVADNYRAEVGTPLTVAAAGLLRNDHDVDGPALVAIPVTGPLNGTLLLNGDGSFTYTPRAGFTGTDHFSYQVTDGTEVSDPAMVTIRVLAMPMFLPPGMLPGPAQPEPVAGDPPAMPGPEPLSPAMPAIHPPASATSDHAPVDRVDRDRVATSDHIATRARSELSLASFGRDTARRDQNGTTGEERLAGRPNAIRFATPAAHRAITDTLHFLAEPGTLWQELNSMREQMQAHVNTPTIAVASVVTSTVGLSVGYVVWLLRGGMLLSSLLTSMPAWRLIDPLPILDTLGRDNWNDDENDESLESIIQASELDGSPDNQPKE